MAIDGVKIIDSDDGHDIYNAIVERYKDGVSLLDCDGLFVVEDRASTR
nr:hypothetical protein [Veillonella sp.]